MLMTLIYDVLIILSAGFFAGLVCRRLGVSMLVGYLVVGAIIGESSLGLVADEHHQIEYIAEAGVFLLLFSIGLEFSLEELLKLGRQFFIGGGAQMLLAAAPTAAVLLAAGVAWQPTLLISAACAFSSTVLVFKALAEWGQLHVPHGRRAIGILLFQDAALVPLLLVVPLITGAGESTQAADYAVMAITSLLFVASVVLLRRVIARWVIPNLAAFRSPELIVLFTLVAIGGSTLAAYSLKLPPAIGAFAAGLVFSGNRWTQQVDALIFPFRESFAAIFFVSLGLIAQPALLWLEPILFFACLLGIVVAKMLAAAIALRLTGLRWRQAVGMGVGLAHIGEFAFVLMVLGWESGVITTGQYQRVVTISLASLIATPLLLRMGLNWAGAGAVLAADDDRGERVGSPRGQAVVIGAGPTGRQVASRLETTGRDVCVIDFSPVNLQSFAQQGFRTVSGDAAQAEILQHAGVPDAEAVLVCVPDDESALRIASATTNLNPDCLLLVRCRYHATAPKLMALGADRVVSEEAQASAALMGILDEYFAAEDVPANIVADR